MDNELNDTMIAELTRARKIIYDGGGFICLALLEEYTTEDGPGEESSGAIEYLCDYIEETLCGAFYRAWLDRHCHEFFIASNARRKEMLRAARLAWIDAMIAALEKGEPLPEKPSLPEDYKGEV